MTKTIAKVEVSNEAYLKAVFDTDDFRGIIREIVYDAIAFAEQDGKYILCVKKEGDLYERVRSAPGSSGLIPIQKERPSSEGVKMQVLKDDKGNRYWADMECRPYLSNKNFDFAGYVDRAFTSSRNLNVVELYDDEKDQIVRLTLQSNSKAGIRTILRTCHDMDGNIVLKEGKLA